MIIWTVWVSGRAKAVLCYNIVLLAREMMMMHCCVFMNPNIVETAQHAQFVWTSALVTSQHCSMQQLVDVVVASQEIRK